MKSQQGVDIGLRAPKFGTGLELQHNACTRLPTVHALEQLRRPTADANGPFAALPLQAELQFNCSTCAVGLPSNMLCTQDTSCPSHNAEHQEVKLLRSGANQGRSLLYSLACLLGGLSITCSLLVHQGVLKVPMPHPAQGNYFHPWPSEAPFLPRAPEAAMLNSVLQQHAVRLFEGQLHGVETVTVESTTGRLLLPDKWGDIHVAQLLPNGSYQLNPKPLAQLGPGRVLGNKLDANGNLVMCDVLKGLLRLNMTDRRLEQLTSQVSSDSADTPDTAIFYANSLDIAPNGSIYFTSSTDILPARARDGSYDTGFAWVLNNFRALPTGRLLVYHPHIRRTHVVASGFFYSDGVALSDDGSYVLVVETDALRVIKIWLEGDKAGQHEVLIDSLPGLPAGLSKASDGNYWVSMTVPVPPYSRYLGSPLLRALIAWSPRTWRPPVKVWGAVLKVSPEGRILQLLLDPTGARVATASAATEHNGRLFLGSIMGGPFVSYVELSHIESHLSSAAAEAWNSSKWENVGGWSLHEQQDLWSKGAVGRVKRL